jgi:AcrR family transcriptional regulator
VISPRQGDDPRANQKARTRGAIVEGAKRLQEKGETPSVAGAAKEAGVSRATAYRYFPTQESLVVELVEITPTVAATEEGLTRLATDDVEERVRFIQDSLNPVALADEPSYRRALWVYQDTWLRSHRDGDPSPAVREGRRMRWLDQALEPLGELPPELDRRLKAALALTLGGDSIVIMKDVCRLDDEEALDVLRWAATVILHAGLAELRASTRA